MKWNKLFSFGFALCGWRNVWKDCKNKKEGKVIGRKKFIYVYDWEQNAKKINLGKKEEAKFEGALWKRIKI